MSRRQSVFAGKASVLFGKQFWCATSLWPSDMLTTGVMGRRAQARRIHLLWFTAPRSQSEISCFGERDTTAAV